MIRMRQARGYAAATIAVCAVLAVIAGLVIGGGPMQARMEKRDLDRLSDLRQISAHIACLAEGLGRLPDTPAPAPYCPEPPPLADPYTGAAYRYERIDGRHWRVCATFELTQPDRLPDYPGDFDARSGCVLGSLPAEAATAMPTPTPPAAP